MKISRILFPRDDSASSVKRWANITLRTIHLIGVAGVGGGFLYQAPKTVWLPYLALSIVSGFGIICLDIWNNRVWLIQLRGIAILIKLILLLCVLLFKKYEALMLVIVIVISGIIAHAPGDVRYFSIFHGRRIDDLTDLGRKDSRKQQSIQ